MKVAVISDLHGNLPALEAVLTDIKGRDITMRICLGDIIGKGPNSPEAVDICREQCDVVVAGNWDKYIANTHKRDASIEYYTKQLGPKRLEYLRGLPEFTEFFLSGKLVRLFHAHPWDVFRRIFPASEVQEKITMFAEPTLAGRQSFRGGTDIAGYGDIHWAYLQNIQGRVLFNAGSVGNPLDMTLASYVILEGEYGSRLPGTFSLQFCRVPYDIELAVRQARAGNPPQLSAYIQELRTAVYSRR